ncbi:hypothetical protein EG68_00032 [Paragonimus skrjabini miyazakii]|uniref:Uncharacterized protein n=1 Tax=Paragonimus skrjabini miyazakii TaxID=59628 RepID=A0A8S9Z9T6_9TREM|nr:hypothetical protein EG68_00032 [Paragonimus skrjabini miyazakii]
MVMLLVLQLSLPINNKRLMTSIQVYLPHLQKKLNHIRKIHFRCLG